MSLVIPPFLPLKASALIRENEFVSILGPSGCGKTTLLNIIGGLDRYTSGDLLTLTANLPGISRIAIGIPAEPFHRFRVPEL